MLCVEVSAYSRASDGVFSHGFFYFSVVMEHKLLYFAALLPE
jgi:hypothetical protein